MHDCALDLTHLGSSRLLRPAPTLPLTHTFAFDEEMEDRKVAGEVYSLRPLMRASFLQDGVAVH